MENDLRGDVTTECSLHLKEARGGVEGQFLLTLYSYINYFVPHNPNFNH